MYKIVMNKIIHIRLIIQILSLLFIHYIIIHLLAIIFTIISSYIITTSLFLISKIICQFYKNYVLIINKQNNNLSTNNLKV